MILGFKKQFVEPILNGTKIHTIREDSNNRWKVGNKIHFATGVRTKNYNQFAEGVVDTILGISIIYVDGKPHVFVYPDGDQRNEKGLPSNVIEELAKNDGFESVDDFFGWFSEDFVGRIIYWKPNLKRLKG